MNSVSNKRIPVALPNFNGNELKYLSECIKTSWVSSNGPYVKKFEREFASYCGTSYGVSTSNGTVALHLALVSLGIGDGDEVILPALTYIASANAVKYCGAKPVFVDSDFSTWNIDVNKIEESITPKTKAIMAVHLYGNPCDMRKIREIADKYSLFVIEDAAEAHGASVGGKKVGSLSDIGCFSFYGNKIITCGEGGMCLTDNEKLAEKMVYLRGHAMSKDKKYWHDHVGFNYRMTNMQAAVGLAQLERIDEFLASKMTIIKNYHKYLNGVNGIYFQKEYPDAKSVYWLVSVMFDDKLGWDRNKVADYLEKNGVETRPVFYPVNHMPPYKQDLRLGVCEKISANSLSLPSFFGLDEDSIKFICSKIISSIDVN